MAPLRYTAKFDPFLSLDCAPTPSTLAQSKVRKGSNFAIWQPWDQDPSTAQDQEDPLRDLSVVGRRAHSTGRADRAHLTDQADPWARAAPWAQGLSAHLTVHARPSVMASVEAEAAAVAWGEADSETDLVSLINFNSENCLTSVNCLL